MSFKTIAYTQKNIKIIKKSKFITIVEPISDKNEVQSLFKKYKEQYYDATHICFAYVIGREFNYMKAYDDGEPNGTAGIPILNIIKIKSLTNVIIFVVRYFGGIKLGTGGLIRAYSQCAKEIIDNCEIIILQKYFYYKVVYKLKNTKFAKKILASISYEKLIESYEDDRVILKIRINTKINIFMSKIEFIFIKHDY